MKSVTEQELTDCMMGSCEGICIECGSTQGGCEPDAERYYCEACGKNTVYGIEQAFIMGLVRVVK